LTRPLAGRYHARALRSVSLAGGACASSIGARASGDGLGSTSRRRRRWTASRTCGSGWSGRREG